MKPSKRPLVFEQLAEGPLVSVLMPVYNAERFIVQAIGSILAQDYGHWELLIINDGSTDGTQRFLDGLTDARIRVFQNAENEGYLRACNRLFGEVRGALLTFLDADDTCVPGRLGRCVSRFMADAQLGFITTGYCRTDADGEVISTHVGGPDLARLASDPTYYPTICCATVMLRRELLDRVGGYHPVFHRISHEDYHWIFQLAFHANGGHLHEVAYHYRMHPAQTHLCNTDPLRFFAGNIDSDLRAATLSGAMSAHEGNAVRSKWERHMLAHPQELRFRQATSALNHGRLLRSLRLGVGIPWTAPIQPSSWRLFFSWNKSFIGRLLGLHEREG